MSLTPKNWKKFQHYSDRKPGWIKLHRDLLDDYQFIRLPLASQALAPRLWLLASEYEGGQITADLDEIAFRLHCTHNEVREALQPLIDAGFFIDDSNALAERYQDACLEKERETETQVETEKNNRSLRSRTNEVPHGTSDWPKDYRDKFWSAYPRKKAKQAAFKALDRVRRDGKVPFGQLMAGLEKIPKNDPQFIPHPATWLNQGRWDDEVLPGENDGHRGSRALQDDSRSVSRAADRLAKQYDDGILSFPPRPSLVSGPGEENRGLLPAGRSAGPGDVRCGAGAGFIGVSDGNGGIRDRPTDGDHREISDGAPECGADQEFLRRDSS